MEISLSLIFLAAISTGSSTDTVMTSFVITSPTLIFDNRSANSTMDTSLSAAADVMFFSDMIPTRFPSPSKTGNLWTPSLFISSKASNTPMSGVVVTGLIVIFLDTVIVPSYC